MNAAETLIGSHYQSNPTRRELVIVFLIFLFLYLVGASVPLLGVPDEARYVEIPREMIVLHDYITPHLNFLKYFEKPPLFYWMQCLAIKTLGFHRLVYRLPTLLMGVCGVLMTFFFTYRWYGRKTAWIAGFILAFSPLYFIMAHYITLDMTLSVFLSASLLCFITAAELDRTHPTQKWYARGFYVFSALAVMTKGLIGLLLPGMIAILWILTTNNWSVLKKSRMPSGIALFLIITLPWHYLVGTRNAEFWYFYFVEQQWLRYLTYGAQRYKSHWFFIPVLLLGAFPWIALLPSTFSNALKNLTRKTTLQSRERFLWIWVISLFVFFSFSKSQLMPYILPLFPPLAILLSHYLYRTLTTQPQRLSFPIFLMLTGILANIVIIAILPRYFPTHDPIRGPHSLLILNYIQFAGLLLGGWFWLQRHNSRSLICIGSSYSVMLIAVVLLLTHMHDFSTKPLIGILKNTLKPTDQVINYHTYDQDLPLYLQQRVVITSWSNELDFGAAHQADGKEWLIDDREFNRRWKSSQRIFAVLDPDSLSLLIDQGMSYYWIKEANNHLLISNQEI